MARVRARARVRVRPAKGRFVPGKRRAEDAAEQVGEARRRLEGPPPKVQRVLFRPVVDRATTGLSDVQKEGDLSSGRLAVPLGVHGDGPCACATKDVHLSGMVLLQRLHVAESVPLARPTRLAVGQEAARDFALAAALRTGVESRSPGCRLRETASRSRAKEYKCD